MGRGGKSGKKSRSGGRGRGSRGRPASGAGRHQYERTERVGELIREIVADELLRIDDDDLQFVTVTGVSVDRELFRAHVYLSTLDLDEAEIAPIEQHNKRLRQAVARQARLRKTPELVFELDPALIAGSRISELLRTTPPAAPASSPDPPVPSAASELDEADDDLGADEQDGEGYQPATDPTNVPVDGRDGGDGGEVGASGEGTGEEE